MSGQTLTTGPVGWFGKLPAAGDFLQRRLPNRFRSPWDAWLRAGMAAAQASLGEQWDERYLRFPVWNFLRALASPESGMSASSTILAGALFPSVDKVGRFFPLTIAFEIPQRAFVQLAFPTIEGRLAEIEALTLDVLGNDDVPAFEAALVGLAPLETPNAFSSGEMHASAACLPPLQWATPLGWIESLGRHKLLECLSERTLFWTRDELSSYRMLLAQEPLESAVFCELVGVFQ